MTARLDECLQERCKIAVEIFEQRRSEGLDIPEHRTHIIAKPLHLRTQLTPYLLERRSEVLTDVLFESFKAFLCFFQELFELLACLFGVVLDFDARCYRTGSSVASSGLLVFISGFRGNDVHFIKACKVALLRFLCLFYRFREVLLSCYALSYALCGIGCGIGFLSEYLCERVKSYLRFLSQEGQCLGKLDHPACHRFKDRLPDHCKELPPRLFEVADDVFPAVSLTSCLSLCTGKSVRIFYHLQERDLLLCF